MARLFVSLVLAVSLVVSTAAPAMAQEPIDLVMMTRIRQEGFTNSKVMETLWHMTEVIGPRLTNSPQLKQANEWTRQQLESWGLQNAHLEAWGPFGRGWSMQHVSVHMRAPQNAPLIAYPKAWTPGTNGVVRGKVVWIKELPRTEKDLEAWKGKLAGMVILVGDERNLEPLSVPLANRYSEEQLDDVHDFEIPAERRQQFNREAIMARIKMQSVVNKFLEDEKALAVVEPSSWDRGVVRIGGGGSYRKGESVGIPSVVMAVEHFNRIARLVDKKMDVELELDVRTTFHDEDEMGYNTIAEIPGTDLKDEVVMLGGHLDSWHAGTGTTDNGAGCAVMMEAVRILQALGVRPRRTIRIALWTGEEQGLLGSRAYVSQHFASRPEPPEDQRGIPSFLRRPTGPLTVKADHSKFSAYFNMDNGTGRIRGVYLQGNAAVMPIFKAWLAPFEDLGASTVTMRNTGGTDHLAFDAVGLPGFQFIQDRVEYSSQDANGLTHHSNMDTYDRAVRQDLMQASVILAAFVYNAAMRNEKLPRKPMPKDESDDDN